MTIRPLLIFLTLCFVLPNSVALATQSESGVPEVEPPNIVFIMSDELAYYELSHMGNPYIRTPNIDQMAAEGIRFTQALAAAPVCAPLRGALMTGKHMGHASIRTNGGGTPLRADEVTIASILKQKGFATGGFGKWGAGGRDSTGVPEKHGFDVFFGYYDQVHAHSFFPPYLIRNSEEIKLDGNIGGRQGKTYSHYSIMDEALDFIKTNHDRPFFCYLPITPPHGMYDIPANDPAWKLYQNDSWIKDPAISQDTKNYAAMVSMVDYNLKQVLDLLKELDLEKNTIVFFTGDNGGQDRFRSKKHPRGFFGPNVNPLNNVEFRGGKGNLYEGGLRIPFIVRWPSKIAPGTTSDLLFNQVDILPTLADLTGAQAPSDIDGLSILPELIGPQQAGRPQEQHLFLYWEHGSQTAIRMKNWKAIQTKKDNQWELYNLNTDLSEARDIAHQHPKIIKQMKQYALESHEPAQQGTYTTKTRHERDRKAKFGTSKVTPLHPKTKKMNRITHPKLVAPSNMKILKASSQNQSNNRVAANAIDGKPETVWHTQFSNELKSHPHELILDLGKPMEVEGFRYLARQDGRWNGAFADTEFTVSDSPDQFPTSQLKITFKKTSLVQSANLDTPIPGRYVKIKILSEINGRPWASAADLGIIAR